MFCRKFLANRREEEEHIKHMEEEEREVKVADEESVSQSINRYGWGFQVHLQKLSGDERSKIVRLVEKHCKQMLDLIYRKKIAYFESGGDGDWKEILGRSYPKEPPPVTPPMYTKEQVSDDFTICPPRDVIVVLVTSSGVREQLRRVRGGGRDGGAPSPATSTSSSPIWSATSSTATPPTSRRPGSSSGGAASNLITSTNYDYEIRRPYRAAAALCSL